ncbi:MAG: RIP metalloprotease RseP [Gammaproteobacteria bacterium]|jgi:regulator of sigma E protease|nr:RIP metalloprotease RseP [Gammaproteobacteria bacterium]HJP03716.1 RIP metalloprotease RseP [Gammaproteobacteria bacterium]
MGMIILDIFAFLAAIGILVAVHEWGHYVAARLAGVKVLRFSIGFGRPLWIRRGGPDQTEYRLSSIPLGGYVKLLDEREGEVPEQDLHRAFNRQPVRQRIGILVAGPAMNFVFAVFAYWLMFVIGVPGLKPIVGEVEPQSIASDAGLEYKDRIVGIGEHAVATWEGAVLAIIDTMLDNKRIRMELATDSGRSKIIDLNIEGRVKELTEPGMLFSGLGFAPWVPSIDPVMGEISPGGAAEAADLRSGDRIVAAADTEFTSWLEWVQFVQAHPNETVDLAIERNGRPQQLPLTIGQAQNEDGATIGRIGAGPDIPENFNEQYSGDQRYGPWDAVGVAVDKTWSMSVLTIRMVARMVTGEVSVKNISGPINIAQYAGYSIMIGLASFLNFLAVVSLSLGILNLLPIPILDGGQAVYQLCEAIKGRPLSTRAQLIGQQLGIVFLVLVMSFAFYNDLTRVFS